MSVAIFLAAAAAAATAQVPSSQHVVLVIDENHSFGEVLANMPWIVSEGNANGYAANYQSDNGGSLLDYLWLASGSCESSANCALPSGTNNFNCTGNDCYDSGTATIDPITDNNIFRLLNQAGLSWRVYAQSYTLAGGTVTTPDNNYGTSYYRRHNAATWYSDILSNVVGSQRNIVDLSELAGDVANGRLPHFMIIVPDGNNDAHDCPVGMSSCNESQPLVAADAFLSANLGPILATPDFQPGGDGLAFVTFDECGDGTDAGCGSAVYTAVIGPKVIPHTVSNIPYRHENTLRTMLDALGIRTYPGASATAADMSDFFTASGANPQVVVSSPASVATVSSPAVVQATASPSAGHTISGWSVYVDNVNVYQAGAVGSIDPALTMSTGSHTVVVRAWDTSGAFASQTLSLTVNAAEPAVTIAAPANNAGVDSPAAIQATATPTAGHTISGWWIYVDGAGVYNGGAVTALNANITMSVGTHTVLVRAWDTSGTFGSQTLTLTVASNPAVSVSAPASNSSLASPVTLQASATPSTGHSITGWIVYLDGVGIYQGGAATSISTKVEAEVGGHTLVVRAWDSSGSYGSQTVPIVIATAAADLTTSGTR